MSKHWMAWEILGHGDNYRTILALGANIYAPKRYSTLQIKNPPGQVQYRLVCDENNQVNFELSTHQTWYVLYGAKYYVKKRKRWKAVDYNTMIQNRLGRPVTSGGDAQ